MLILLHGLGSSRAEWRPLVEAARARGWGTLAYDLRGHAESNRTAGGAAVDYNDPRFGRDPAFWGLFPGDLADVAAAAKKRGVPPERTVLAGASLGANVCLLSADALGVAAAVLLSPGLDYAGLKTEARMAGNRTPALLVAARPDRYAFASAVRLAESSGGRAGTLFLDRGGAQGVHGVQMFDGVLEGRILDWAGKKAEKR